MNSLQHPSFVYLLGLFWLPRPNYSGINYRGIFSGNLVVTKMAMARISVRSLTEKVKKKMKRERLKKFVFYSLFRPKNQWTCFFRVQVDAPVSSGVNV